MTKADNMEHPTPLRSPNEPEQTHAARALIPRCLGTSHHIAKEAMMTVTEQLHKEIDQLPEALAVEVLDFLRFIRIRHVPPEMPRDALAERIANPWKVDTFTPLTRDGAHER
jgi:hypothetical protein